MENEEAGERSKTTTTTTESEGIKSKQDKDDNPTVLNIPKVTTSSSCSTPAPSSTPAQESNCSISQEDLDESIGEFDDGRTGKLTLTILIQEGLIEPGDGVMTIDYLGQTFKGDLLPIGRIKSQETGLVFNNPSAWAIYCKKIVNPAKKSGCGWASVKYKGRKMDFYKNQWLKIKNQREAEEAEKRAEEEALQAEESGSIECAKGGHSAIIQHSQLGLRNPNDPLDVLIEMDTFFKLGRIQPFTVSVSSSALLIMDLHSHLSITSACGYFAGQWDLTSHNLAITHAFPCLLDPDKVDNEEEAARTEYEIYNSIYSKHLTIAGWYKSAPKAPKALPSLSDCESQLDHQVRLLGTSDASYTPCVGLILRPYVSNHNESELAFYWVVPPLENAPLEYGKPVRMECSKVIDPCLSDDLLVQVDAVINFYRKHETEMVKMDQNFNSDTTFITKMGKSLLPKFPKDQDERLWSYIRSRTLGPSHTDIPDPLIDHAKLINGGVNGHGGEQATHHDDEEEEIDDVEDEEEEEIDDDEENALRRRRGSRSQSNGNNSNVLNIPSRAFNTPSTSTANQDDMISQMLQRQAPVAHGASKAVSTFNQDDEDAPLDFSTSAKKDH